MSALPPKADIRQRIEHVCFVPEADITRAATGLCQAVPTGCTSIALVSDMAVQIVRPLGSKSFFASHTLS